MEEEEGPARNFLNGNFGGAYRKGKHLHRP